MFKKNKEVIEMEQTTFIQKHAKKILLVGGVVVTAGAYYILKKHNVEIKNHEIRITNVENKLQINTDIAVKSLNDTIEKYDFEINELIFKRDNLDQSATQNVFMNIPKLNQEIELKTRLKENTIALLEKAIETGKTE
jgi:hypothetical protein